MRVLFIAEQLDRPEARVMIGLAAAGVEVTVMMPAADPARALLEDGQVQTRPLELRRRYDRAARKEIRRTIEAGRFEIVHCLRNNRPLANTVLAIRGTGARLVAYRGTMGNLSRFDPASWMTYLHPRLDRIVCVSEGVRSYLLGLGVPATRAVTIHKGHDPAWYADAPIDRAELGVSESAFVIGCIANMRPLKGVDLLIESLTRLKDCPPICLLLVGEVRDESLQSKIDAYTGPHRILALGFRSDATRIAGCFNLIAMPSRRREGLPRSVIESMAQGVPAVVSRVGGMPELVRDGIDGVVVDPNSAASLSRGLRRMIENPTFCLDCGTHARERIETDFHFQRTVEKTLAMYRELLPEHAPPEA